MKPWQRVTGALAIASALVAAHEGRSLVAYVDPVGIPTICEGITAGVRLGDRATPQQCDALLEIEVRRSLSSVERLATVQMPDTRKAALASFVYNVGETQFSRSTLLRKLNAGDAKGACAELSRWVYAGGKVYKGLVNRRKAERELCEQGL